MSGERQQTERTCPDIVQGPPGSHPPEQERQTENRAASFGYQGLGGFEGDWLHGGYARLVLNVSGRLAGVLQLYGTYDPKNFVARQGNETYRSSGGETVVIASGVGLTIPMSDRVGLTTTLDALSPFPNPLRGVYGLVTSAGVTIAF